MSNLRDEGETPREMITPGFCRRWLLHHQKPESRSRADLFFGFFKRTSVAK